MADVHVTLLLGLDVGEQLARPRGVDLDGLPRRLLVLLGEFLNDRPHGAAHVTDERRRARPLRAAGTEAIHVDAQISDLHAMAGARGVDAQAHLTDLIERVQQHSLVKLHTDATIEDFSGHVGKFKATLNENGQQVEVGGGAVIVATPLAEVVELLL